MAIVAIIILLVSWTFVVKAPLDGFAIWTND